jgi:hypothetical protein
MPLRVKPFEKKEDGTWAGQFGRLQVTVRERETGTYWRGTPSEIVLERPRIDYSFSVHGRYSGSAQTLEGAFEAAEIGCHQEQGYRLLNPRYTMTPEQREIEAQAVRMSGLDAIEADRIATERGMEGKLAVDVLPALKLLALEEGLYPFKPEVVPSRAPSP